MADSDVGPPGQDPQNQPQKQPQPNVAAEEQFTYSWPEGQSAPTGWYYATGDPPDTERYWNGTEWEGEPVSVYGTTPARRPMPPPPTARPVPQAEVPYALWISRLGAILIDVILIAVLTIPMNMVSPGSVNPVLIPSPFNPLGFFSGLDSVISAIVTLITFVGIAWVWAWSPGETGQTPGKRMVGISVVDERKHQALGHTRHIFRTLAAYLNSLVCYLGWLWPLWDKKNQTLADKAVGSVVLTTKKGPIWPLVPSKKATPEVDGPRNQILP